IRPGFGFEHHVQVLVVATQFSRVGGVILQSDRDALAERGFEHIEGSSAHTPSRRVVFLNVPTGIGSFPSFRTKIIRPWRCSRVVVQSARGRAEGPTRARDERTE